MRNGELLLGRGGSNCTSCFYVGDGVFPGVGGGSSFVEVFTTSLGAWVAVGVVFTVVRDYWFTNEKRIRTELN